MLKFCPIASGSNGNSIYVGTEKTHILIDAGLSGRKIENGLRSINLNANMLNAIFITHEHTDHIQGVGILSRRFDLPIFATEKTWAQIQKHSLLGKIDEKNIKVINTDETCILNDLELKPFLIPHDSAEPVGYTIQSYNRKIAIATDIGHITDNIKNNIYGCDAILLESNHDLEMLENGRYPYHLKARVKGNNGHLSNSSAGELLAEIMSSKTKHVFLGHLSEENNRPIIAMDTVMKILMSNKIKVGKDLSLYLANRGIVSQMLELNTNFGC